MISSEIWRDVPEYEGLYKVSNRGRLRGPSGKLLKCTKNHDGYLVVNLCKNGKRKIHRLHRIVATAFIPNPDNKPQVNHKNGKKTDCSVDNLEWTDISENQKHRAKVLNKRGSTRKRKVVCTTTGDEYKSLSEAARQTGAPLTNILKGCRGCQISTHGLQFTYKGRRK